MLKMSRKNNRVGNNVTVSPEKIRHMLISSTKMGRDRDICITPLSHQFMNVVTVLISNFTNVTEGYDYAS